LFCFLDFYLSGVEKILKAKKMKSPKKRIAEKNKKNKKTKRTHQGGGGGANVFKLVLRLFIGFLCDYSVLCVF
jgi:hypothetical protein